MHVHLALDHMHLGALSRTRINSKHRASIHRAPACGGQREAFRHRRHVRSDEAAENLGSVVASQIQLRRSFDHDGGTAEKL